jgi:hypothetical protein
MGRIKVIERVFWREIKGEKYSIAKTELSIEWAQLPRL